MTSPALTASIALFWASFALVVYAYALYPALIAAASRLFGKANRPPDPGADPPTATLLIAAYNEATVIGARLENALALEYPPGRLSIVVASDGSDDGTAEIVRGFEERGVRLIDSKERRGKSAVLNATIAGLTDDLVLLSDANTFNDPDAAIKLARWFADPGVGSVVGKLVLTDPRTGRNADGLYWKYENVLKRCEGRLGGLLGANGAIYAIRRRLYVPIPDRTIVDDFVIPLLAKQEHGGSILYDREAIAREETPASIGSEFHRRARIGAGGFQAIGLLWRLLDPRRGWVAFTFASHKVLRWLCPAFLILCLGGNLAAVALGGPEPYRALLGLQALFYLVAAGGAFAPPGPSPWLKPARLVTLFVSMNAALLVGFFRWSLGRQKGTWRRTERGSMEAARR